MSTQLTRQCQPADPAQSPPGPCKATFTANGQAGNQKLLGGGMVALQADETQADTYTWEVTSSPPSCDYLLTGATQPQAKLLLPGPGAYVVQLSLTKGACNAQHRVILWVATPVNLYRLPATSEPLRFDGKAEWAGDLAAVLLNVDANLPTPAQKAAMDRANQPGADNPFATLHDLSGTPGSQDGELTADEIAAIRAAEQPDANNRFVTDSDRQRTSPTVEQKAALDAAARPHAGNAFVTESRLHELAPTRDQKEAMDEAEEPRRENAFVTDSVLQRVMPTPDQRAALDLAEAPAAGNPYVTESRLERLELPLDQRAGLNRAWDPGAENPFVTVSHAQTLAPTPDQRAALTHAVEPKADNPFVTVAHMQDYAPTPDQRSALNRAVDPDWDNPFVTERRLAEAAPTPDQRAALHRAADPGWNNPLVTVSHMHRFMPTPSQKEALDGAQDPDANNPYVTTSEMKEYAPTANQKAGLDAADAPSASNPFVTQRGLPSPQLTDAELQAIHLAQAPGPDNPFVTRSALPPDELGPAQKAALGAADRPGADNPFVTRSALPPAELTPEQKAALAEADRPSAENPFVTQSMLPGDPAPPVWPLGLTETQNAALDAADTFPDPHKPGAANPFVTQSMLPADPAPSEWPIGLTATQDAALDAADALPDPYKPGAENPFVTLKMLPADSAPPAWPIGLTLTQDAALDAADAFPDLHKPSATNPFVTQSMLPAGAPPTEWPVGLTPTQDAALDAADAFPDPHRPSAENPFVTQSMLADVGMACALSEDQCAAIQAASDFPDPNKPNAANPFITESMVPTGAPPTEWPIGLTVTQDAALDAADAFPDPHKPSAENPFVTQSMLANVDPSCDMSAEQCDAIKAASTASVSNRFATMEDIPDFSCDMSAEQCDAIKAATTATAANRFATMEDIPDFSCDMSAAQCDAIKAATTASASNRFATIGDLPSGEVPPDWPIGLSKAQDDALDAAEAFPEHTPGLLNPFLTQSRWEETAPTIPQKEALDAASRHPVHPPSANNPFATIEDLKEIGPGPGPAGPCDLDANHCDAIKRGLGVPTGANPFVSRDYVLAALPLGVTEDQRDALDNADAPGANNPVVTHTQWSKSAPTDQEKAAMAAANQPDHGNPFATMADLGQAGFTTRVVAAGNLDLQANTAVPTVGGLKVVTTVAASGLATLAFDGYARSREDHYLVKALPVNGQAGANRDSLTVAQLVEFTDQGFVLHLAQPLARTTNLGRCMIEVSEMMEVVTPTETRLEQAIRLYYSLIRQRRYEDAWPMVSQRYRDSHRRTTYISSQQERAIPGFDVNIRHYWSELILVLQRNGAPLNAAAVQNFWYRVLHLDGVGGQPHPQSPLGWDKSRLGQDGNRSSVGVWHVSQNDGREQNSDWYRIMIYSGEPPAWPDLGKPIAWSGDFQLPAKGNEQVITIDLNPASQPLDLAGFKAQWEASGPASIKALKRSSATATHALYELDLLYTGTNRRKRIQSEYEHDQAKGHQRFDFWQLVDDKELP